MDTASQTQAATTSTSTLTPTPASALTPSATPTPTPAPASLSSGAAVSAPTIASAPTSGPVSAPAADTSALSFCLGSDPSTVVATYTPPVPPPQATAATPNTAANPVLAPTLAVVQALLRQGGWGHWWVDEPALDKWRQQIPQAKQPLSATIAQRRDARCTVTVARDRMSATLSLTPPQGGNPLTLDQARQALADKGIKAGILDKVLAATVDRGEATERVVAQGKPAVNGEHTRFDKLVADMVERHPHVYEDGWVDYRDLGDLVVVKAGTPLLRRVPPTTGEAGFDVLGNSLTPKPGTNWPFAPGLKGVEPAPGDPDLLLASVTGQPVMVSHGVKVDPNIVLPHVDLSTGNVTFDGAVNIKGDVKDGMKVTSTGDVMVGGAVLAGEIEAGGNVTIKGGVIGHSEYNGHASGRQSWFSAKVVAKGTIHARYAENACLQADTDVVLDDYAMHSEITALNHVTMGKPGTKKGRCIGGHTRAGISIRVAESGSDAGPATLLQAGTNPLVDEEMATLAKAIDKHTMEIATLQKIIDFVHTHPERDKDGLLGRATITQELHQGEMLELQALHADLQATHQLSEDAHITVDVSVHGGTQVRVGTKVWTTADTRARGVFRLSKEGELVLGSP